MNVFDLLIFVGCLAVLVVFIYLTIQSSQKDIQNSKELAHNLGFTPFQSDMELETKISKLYFRPGIQNHYQLRNVFRKIVAGGEMYLFDLVETSGEDASWVEHQAVAILSPCLALPPFAFFPQADKKDRVSGLANRVGEWGLSKMGTLVVLPEYPVFNAHYVVASSQPKDVQHFFNEPLARYFSHTQMCMLHAGGDIFTFSEIRPRSNHNNPEDMNRRINSALEIFHLIQN